MKHLRFWYFTFFLLCLSSFMYGQRNEKGKNIQTINGKKYYLHKVEKGQSLYGIAKMYDSDLNTLIVENPEAIDGIKSGQELKIPVEKRSEQNQPSLKDYEEYLTHKVSKGETIYGICHRYQITEQQLTQLNPNIKNGLKENTVLKIKEKNEAVAAKENTPHSNINSNPTHPPHPVQEPEKKPEPKEEEETNPKENTEPIELTNKQKKNKYTVALFLPFMFSSELNVDELVSNKQDFPIAQQLALDTYEGLKQAADSLATSDFSIEFKLYDIAERDSASLLKMVQTHDFQHIDLIIGPLYNAPFKFIAGEAKKYQIPCVSPFTQQNKILFNNVFTSKVIASNNTLLEGLAAFCADSMRQQQVVLINSGHAKDAPNVALFKEYYNKQSRDTLTEARGIAGAKATYKAEKTTYYIVPTENEVFISDFLTQLNVFANKKENICVIGLKKWVNYDNLDLEYFNKFKFTYATTHFIENEHPFIKKMNAAYLQKYNTNAEDYYYLAADIGLYYFNLLKQVGSAFSVSLEDMSKKGTCLNYRFIHPNNDTGFENKAIQIIRYSDYTLKKIN
ncbi:MAG: LysM peptidoglycan-binding domain-containing protein [Bacteroidetes bacterium]|nr:LysM peptidoglycan-binding domain-containing protein [Bacteroidota bacterium]